MHHPKTLKDNVNNNLYSNMFTLYTDMLQKLTQNNVEYIETMLSNSLKPMQPLSNDGNPNNIIPLQNLFAETIKNNQKLFENAQEIISSTKDKIMEAVQIQHKVLDHSPINLFNIWSDLNPSVTKMLKTFQDSIPKNVNEEVINKKENTKGDGIKNE